MPVCEPRGALVAPRSSRGNAALPVIPKWAPRGVGSELAAGTAGCRFLAPNLVLKLTAWPAVVHIAPVAGGHAAA